MKYLLNVVETYRVDTVEEALAMRDEGVMVRYEY